MNETSDLVAWIMGIFAAAGLLGWRLSKSSDNDKFKSLFDAERDTKERLGKVETRLDGVHFHFMQTLEEIKAHQLKIGDDLTKIKICVASLPKRKED